MTLTMTWEGLLTASLVTDNSHLFILYGFHIGVTSYTGPAGFFFFFFLRGEIGNLHCEEPQRKHGASGGRFNSDL